MIGGSNNLRFDLFPDPIGYFGYSERVPPVPLGWYLQHSCPEPNLGTKGLIRNVAMELFLKKDAQLIELISNHHDFKPQDRNFDDRENELLTKKSTTP